MLRRAAAVLTGRQGAWLRRLPRRPVMTASALFRRTRQVQPHRGGSGGAPPLPRPCGGLGAGMRGYARMARRLPPARPDGYSSSDGEADEPDAREPEECLEPGAGAEGEEGEDAEGSEWEGFMLDFGSGSGSGNDGEEEVGGKQ